MLSLWRSFRQFQNFPSISINQRIELDGGRKAEPQRREHRDARGGKYDIQPALDKARVNAVPSLFLPHRFHLVQSRLRGYFCVSSIPQNTPLFNAVLPYDGRRRLSIVCAARRDAMRRKKSRGQCVNGPRRFFVLNPLRRVRPRVSLRPVRGRYPSSVNCIRTGLWSEYWNFASMVCNSETLMLSDTIKPSMVMTKLSPST